ncbi:hypothetical protein [Nostoc sp. GT001]|uniref:hypothetical protein n=1 Tax=Nostoc sp. GT001 TaxID=3056647 RepID=UPI0025AB3665|nr:hypothetical protein [Nostoc sp. GT001]MDM9582305.1 hypothetical protein [Nostoc sp. GT001]
MNVTEINRLDILAHIMGSFNRAQNTGLNCLIFLALREQTTIAYQKKEWGFEDIPQQIIVWCDSLEENDLIELGADIAAGLLEELVTDSRDAQKAKRPTVQGIEPQKQPTLLSDY